MMMNKNQSLEKTIGKWTLVAALGFAFIYYSKGELLSQLIGMGLIVASIAYPFVRFAIKKIKK